MRTCEIDQNGNQLKLFMEIPIVLGFQEVYWLSYCRMLWLFDGFRSEFWMDRLSR